MPDTTDRPPEKASAWRSRWGWFLGLYAAGLATVAGLSYGLKALVAWAAGS